MLQADNYREKAVLCFVRQADQVLLIEKKRGLGMGKINAPGGKVESGESFFQAAIRETQEEVCLDITDPVQHGAIGFTFADGYSLYVEIFETRTFTGTPAETAEAKPFWCPVQDIPYHRMWSDDLVWLPQFLAGYDIEASFSFADDLMLDGSIKIKLPGK